MRTTRRHHVAISLVVQKMWLLGNLNSKESGQSRTSQPIVSLLKHEVDELSILLHKQGSIEYAYPLANVPRPLTEQSWQSIVSLEEREYWNSSGCHTKSDPVEHLVLTNLIIHLAVGVVKRLLEQSVKPAIYSNIPLLRKPRLQGDISQPLDPQSWNAPEIKQLNLWRLLLCITVLTSCLSVTVTACCPVSTTTSSPWSRAGLR